MLVDRDSQTLDLVNVALALLFVTDVICAFQLLSSKANIDNSLNA